jgi:AraC-like DNA-binding protein
LTPSKIFFSRKNDLTCTSSAHFSDGSTIDRALFGEGKLVAAVIHRDLEETLGPEVVAHSTVTLYLRTPSFRGKTEEEEIGDHDQRLDEVDEAILKALADEPFPSVGELARHTCLSRATVHRHLTCSLGFTVRHLRWVSHQLSPGQKVKRVALSRAVFDASSGRN